MEHSRQSIETCRIISGESLESQNTLVSDGNAPHRSLRLPRALCVWRLPFLTHLVTQSFEKIIKRAGIEPWSKPFTNLRNTCETELNEQFPSHVVANWLGHSVKIATNHYLQVTDEHHQRALALKPQTSESALIDVTHYEQIPNPTKSIAQNRAQSASAGSGNGLKTTENDISAKKQKQAVTSLGYKGLQPVANSYRINVEISKNGLADGEGFDKDDVSYCNGYDYNNNISSGVPKCVPVLEAVVSAWPTLSPETKIAIMQAIETDTLARR